MMDDKQVGELWKQLFSDCNAGPQCEFHGRIVRLIFKLVEERFDKLSILSGATQDWMRDECKRDALRDFGIPEPQFMRWKARQG